MCAENWRDEFKSRLNEAFRNDAAAAVAEFRRAGDAAERRCACRRCQPWGIYRRRAA